MLHWTAQLLMKLNSFCLLYICIAIRFILIARKVFGFNQERSYKQDLEVKINTGIFQAKKMHQRKLMNATILQVIFQLFSSYSLLIGHL